jgi:hypothetical protein
MNINDLDLHYNLTKDCTLGKVYCYQSENFDFRNLYQIAENVNVILFHSIVSSQKRQDSIN